MRDENRRPLSAETIELAKNILLNRCRERIRAYAYEDADLLRPQLERTDNLTHFLGRLELITRELSTQADVAQRIKLESVSGSIFADHINDLKMSNGGSIYDVLTGKVGLPYETRDLQFDLMHDRSKFDALLTDLNIGDFNAFVGNEFFHEYMQNYFRAARKLAAAGGDE